MLINTIALQFIHFICTTLNLLRITTIDQVVGCLSHKISLEWGANGQYRDAEDKE